MRKQRRKNEKRKQSSDERTDKGDLPPLCHNKDNTLFPFAAQERQTEPYHTDSEKPTWTPPLHPNPPRAEEEPSSYYLVFPTPCLTYLLLPEAHSLLDGNGEFLLEHLERLVLRQIKTIETKTERQHCCCMKKKKRGRGEELHKLTMYAPWAGY